MILTANGEVLTNNHVVEDSVSIKVVVVSTQQTYVARALGTDAKDDVAVLRLVHASGLRTVTIEASGAARTGEAVTAVGNAGGNGGSSTAAAGTVTATHRNITVRSETTGAPTRLTNLIKVDADIQSGDSGGPLYDHHNDVVGMNTAASTGTAKVTGFAVPIATAEAIVNDIAKGRDTDDISLGYPAFLGVELRSTSARGASGASIAGVVAGTGAAKAGLQAGDMITAVDGHAIANPRQLSRTIGQYEPGQTVSVTWADSHGNTSTAPVTLTRGPLT
jgi:S1-C subfamily serine protease